MKTDALTAARTKFASNPLALAEVEKILAIAKKHGTEGEYNLASLKNDTDDMDWYWDVGNTIETCEEINLLREGSVKSLYIQAFREAAAAAKAKKAAAANKPKKRAA